MHVHYQDRRDVGLKCMVEYDDGKQVRFKVDISEEFNAPTRVHVILQQGQVALFRDFCQQFADVTCTKDCFLSIESA